MLKKIIKYFKLSLTYNLIHSLSLKESKFHFKLNLKISLKLRASVSLKPLQSQYRIHSHLLRPHLRKILWQKSKITSHYLQWEKKVILKVFTMSTLTKVSHRSIIAWSKLRLNVVTSLTSVQ